MQLKVYIVSGKKKIKFYKMTKMTTTKRPSASLTKFLFTEPANFPRESVSVNTSVSESVRCQSVRRSVK